ncbi:MAG: hypothetical protein BGO74_09310 [Burkholderiales bacterium 68-12]|uniref:hypothetical protein n=1 Tax=Comamonas granuli TaxID=290309 RepID=UPI0005AB6A84|nr:MAG: hypothetical protein BGO74_09310 [Burkholderiales bacterium 68-12]
MEPLPPSRPTRSRWGLAGLMATAVAALVAACRTAPVGSPAPPDSQDPAGAPSSQSPGRSAAPGASAARSPLDYRKDAARHVYAHNATRIFLGKLPPMLYAIGVLEVDIDRRGQVTRLRWLRAPRHAPEVTAEIERTVRAAAPYPAPARMGRVTWTDTWLWDRSGRFQLDTLTEGQL